MIHKSRRSRRKKHTQKRILALPFRSIQTKKVSGLTIRKYLKTTREFELTYKYYYRDADVDTYGNSAVTTQACSQPSGYVTDSTDCNDSSASINPGALEVCNGVDDNCNGQTDEGGQNTY